MLFRQGKVFTHKRMQINYTGYNMHKLQDSVNIRLHPDIMILVDESCAEKQGHPYLYGRVIGIFHVHVCNATRFSHGPGEKHMEVL
ncbi:hypothetical protein Moror_11864 [Moniliophthora roreri MCA 2997]|uniref:Uncharacterized protein n=1 Tax=Moniliophthora roreri (strain MCA 2997) TaxID=1381753 RepID=V2X014_MONRO|nr:hypothetical protein Moror_11864 [Moniliophthora roreri MCA 2997]